LLLNTELLINSLSHTSKSQTILAQDHSLEFKLLTLRVSVAKLRSAYTNTILYKGNESYNNFVTFLPSTTANDTQQHVN